MAKAVATDVCAAPAALPPDLEVQLGPARETLQSQLDRPNMLDTLQLQRLQAWLRCAWSHG